MKIPAISTLYVCYFGLREPLVQTQVLPYLRQLAADGVKVHLLTFEPALRQWAVSELSEERSRLDAEGIAWHCLPYHKRPSLPATLYDVAVGARFAARLVRRKKIDIIHARSHVPALMAVIAKRVSGARVVFDIRGFMPEEYADAGVWQKDGLLYRGTKVVERRLLSAADAFIVLTEKARAILFPGASDQDQLGRPIEVIPCCVDHERFRVADGLSKEAVRDELQLTGRRVIVYAGALGGWYLTEEMADFLSLAHRQNPQTFSLILTQSDPELMETSLRRRGVPEKDFLIRKVSPSDVPRYLKAADAALSFIKPCYSKLSSSPTKIAEYLASGLPVICLSGVGDTDELLARERVGVTLHEIGPEAYLRALGELDELCADNATAERCRRTAWNNFDLESVGGARYRRLYQRLTGRDGGEIDSPTRSGRAGEAIYSRRAVTQSDR